MASVTRKSYGNKDYLGAELKNHRAHIYATVASMNADVSSSVARVVYCTETARHYFGKPGAWIGLNTASSFGDTVADLSELPVSAADGDVRVVLDDGSGIPTLYIYDTDEPGWKQIADVRLVLKDGSVLLTGILSVEDENVQVPVNPNDLVTKKYSDDELDDHKADPAAHAAAIAAAVSAGSSADIAAHNASPAAHSATIATAVNGGIATHDADPAAHATQIGAGVAAGIATHNAELDAHHGVILMHLDYHDIDPYSHDYGDVSVPNSRSGRGAKGNLFIVDALHGAPLTFTAATAATHYGLAGRAERPVALAWRPSTIVPFSSTAVTFDDGGSNVVGFATAGIPSGSLIRFPDSVLNTGIFKITSIGGGSEFILSPTPVDEAISTTAEVFLADGIAVFSGRFEVDRDEAIVNAATIGDIIDDNGAGKGSILFSPLVDGARLRKGDAVTVAGTVSCNGTYYVDSYDYETDRVVITTTFPAAESGVGTVDIDHNALTHGFGSAPTSPVAYYADVDDAQGYSTTPGNYLLGMLVDANTFAVQIERVDRKEVATITADDTLDAEIYQYVPINFTAADGEVTLPAGANGMVIDVKDISGNAALYPVTLTPDGAELIDGATSFLVDEANMAIRLTWRSGAWRVS